MKKNFSRFNIFFYAFCCFIVLSFATISNAADICEPCKKNSDCDSGNCGVRVDDSDDKRCIPFGATTYECETEDDSSSCFIETSCFSFSFGIQLFWAFIGVIGLCFSSKEIF